MGKQHLGKLRNEVTEPKTIRSQRKVYIKMKSKLEGTQE